MKRLKASILSFLTIVMLAPGPVAAQDITISASVDKSTLALDEQLVLQVNVSGAAATIASPRLPDLPGFTAYSAGSSHNMSFVNGSFSSSMSFRYALVPKSAGRFTIPPVIVEHNGKTYQTQAITVEVVAQGKSPSAPPAPAPARSAAPSGSAGRDLFITAEVDKPSALVNEQVTYIFRFYRRVRLLSNPQYSLPDFSGFWTEDTPPKNFYSTINGQQYLVTEIKTLLFPTRPGTFTLGNASLQCSVEDISPDDFFADSFFSSFFSGGRTQVLRTTPATVNVRPLPEPGKPADFSGAVGRYAISAELDKRVSKASEPVTLTVTVSGTGNIKTIADPGLPAWPDIRKYETASSLSISKEGDLLKGSKTFKTIIVPLTSGRKTLAPLSLTFYDPAQKKYVTATTSPLILDVQPGEAGAGTHLSPPRGEITVVNRDINYIKPLGRWRTDRDPLYRNTLFVAANALPLLMLAFAFFHQRWQERLKADVAFARRRRAPAAAKKYLNNAKKLLATSTALPFYAAVSKALLEYVANKFNVSAEGLTFAAIAELLARKNVNGDTTAKLKTLLDECDLVRFAPTEVSAAMMEQTYRNAEELIDQLEKEFK